MKRDNATNVNSDAAESKDCGGLAAFLSGLKRWMAARVEAHQRRTTTLGVHRRGRF